MRSRALNLVVGAVVLAALAVAGVALAQSDDGPNEDFWAAANPTEGSLAFTYDSVAEIEDDSHVVVRGRVVDLQPGRPVFGVANGRVVEETDMLTRSTLLTIEVDEVLAGNQALVQDGRITNVEVMPLDETSKRAVPSSAAIFFVTSQELEAKESGQSDEVVAHVRGYQSLTHPHGVQIERDGRVVPALESQGHHEEARSKSFTTARTLDELEAEVRKNAG